MIEAFILDEGQRATLSIGPWTAIVDADELRAWAAHSGFDVLHVSAGLSKMILRDAADSYFTMLTWSDPAAEP